MLFGGVIANQQNRGRREDVGHRGRSIRLAAKRRRESREVCGAVVVDIVSLQNHAGKLREQVSFFVRSACRTDHADRLSVVLVANLGELFADERESLFPGRGNQLAMLAD